MDEFLWAVWTSLAMNVGELGLFAFGESIKLLLHSAYFYYGWYEFVEEFFNEAFLYLGWWRNLVM